MAEDIDIDIEEHDLFQNPAIKRIFPDLSILKQELMDFDEGLPEETLHSKETDKKKILDKLNIANGNVSALSIETRVANNFPTKICLKSQPNKAAVNLEFGLIKDIKVVLENITPYLIKTMRFCEFCLILFPHQKSLNCHKLSIHKALKYSSKDDITRMNKKKYKFVQADTMRGSLERHNDNMHYINQGNKEITFNSQIKEDNVMVQAFDLQRNNVFKVCRPCFHCQKLFPNQQDLIDHLYNILYAKKALDTPENIDEKEIKPKESSLDKNNINLQNNINANLDTETIMQRKVDESKNIYSCPICSYYFIEEIFCRSHVIVKHKATKIMQIEKVLFNPKCKFCKFIYYDDILSYNAHLRKSHKIEMLKQVNNDLRFDNVEARQYNSNSLPLPNGNTVNIYAKQGQSTALVQNSKSLDYVKPIYDNIKVIVSKIILFKCSECDIHFLTSDAAFKHFEHARFQENYKCTNCYRLFKNKDATVHQKQHKYSNYFTIVKVFAEVGPRVLYKCFMCSVHFSSKETIFEHFNFCQTEQFRKNGSSYCNDCDIFIESGTEKSHKDDHTVRNFTYTDFKIIYIKSPILKDDDKNHNKIIHDQHKVQNPLQDSFIMDTGNPTGKNIRNKRKSGGTKTSKILSAKKKIIYNYCNVCKCNILCRVYKKNIHLKSLCVNIVKYICKFCGLMFSNKSIISHRKLHHDFKYLKLQDFSFFNMQTNEVMKPLIPDFPKCEFCEKNFISKVEIKGHFCDIKDYFICSICKSKFSETAYKLHMPFHSYDLKTSSKQSYELNKMESCDDLDELNESNFSMDDKTPVIYTCKNCNLSICTYDEAIEHCHLHSNLNNVDVNAVDCSKCQLKFINSSYNKHIELHKEFKNNKITRFNFDVVNFGSDNTKWLKHIFRSISRSKINKLIDDSIYKYETRLKMSVIQEGPSNLIIYKCEKCECIIDCNSTYSHIATCCPNSETSYCTFCDLSFACSITRNNHERIHTLSDITIESYKIVMFNREQDRNVNYNISRFKKCYVLYECRYCHVLVENYNYICHICFRNNSKKCGICGLLVNAENLNDHILKHKLVPSFNENKIKVVLLGSKTEENPILHTNNTGLVPTFNGIVCDYTFYKCIDCEVCVRDVRNTVQHSCLIDAAKSQCIKCDLIFDEGKLKGHLKLHDADPDFTRETILVKPFTNRKPSKRDVEPNKLLLAVEVENNGKFNNENTEHGIKKQIPSNFRTAKLYKCKCGLHFIQQSSLEEHTKKCTGKNKSIQNCSKCCLSFTPEVLFKHLLEHHGDKNVVFKYKIIKN